MLREILQWRLTPRTRRLPLYLVVFVTYRCNSCCRTCFYHDKLNAPESSDLPLAFYDKLARSIPHLAWLHVSGGEPFLRRDLPDLVAAFYRHSGARRIGIPTNALLGARVVEDTRRILDLCPLAQITLVLSLDGLEATHDDLRGVPGGWKRTMQTIENLKRVQAESRRLSINVCTVLTNRNADEMPHLLEYVRTLGVNFHDIGLLRGDFPDKSLELPPLDQIQEVLDLADRYAELYYAEHPYYSPWAARRAMRAHRYLNGAFLDFLRARSVSQPCLAGDGFAVVEPNGDVRLCELTPVIGNLLEFDADFPTFWRSSAVREARRRGGCRDRTCTHSNFQTRNFLLNPLQWWRVLP